MYQKPKKLILFSAKDLAGVNIARILRENYKFQELTDGRWQEGNILLAEVKGEVVYLDKFEEFKPEICVVASRHSSKTGAPCLTAHSPGNFAEAKLGGKDRELAIAPAGYLRGTLLALKSNGKNLKGYDISLEATHHGPTALKFPLLFVEVGATKKEWSDERACRVVATTIYEILHKKPPEGIKIAIGFGGGHYCRKFSQDKVLDKFALGHICPKYNLHHLDEGIIKKMILRTEPQPRYALVEKKGLGSEKHRILDLLKKTELELEII